MSVTRDGNTAMPSTFNTILYSGVGTYDDTGSLLGEGTINVAYVEGCRDDFLLAGQRIFIVPYAQKAPGSMKLDELVAKAVMVITPGLVIIINDDSAATPEQSTRNNPHTVAHEHLGTVVEVSRADALLAESYVGL